MTDERKNEIRRNLKAFPARSAWRKGTKEYAFSMLEELFTLGDKLETLSKAELEKEALSGASSWSEYSWGGCSLIYDRDIAEVLCTPSELKKTRNGERRPNAREEWLDVQARALYQAFIMVNYARRLAGPRG